VGVVPVDRELTTTEAAFLPQDSPGPGAVLLGSHGQTRRAILAELTADAVEMGRYDQPAPMDTSDAA
jgi:hypothetical protein